MSILKVIGFVCIVAAAAVATTTFAVPAVGVAALLAAPVVAIGAGLTFKKLATNTKDESTSDNSISVVTILTGLAWCEMFVLPLFAGPAGWTIVLFMVGLYFYSRE